MSIDSAFLRNQLCVMVSPMSFGKRVAKLKGLLSHREFGELVGCDSAAVSRWCRDRQFPGFETLLKIAKAFEISLDFLMTGEEYMHSAHGELRSVLSNPAKQWLPSAAAEARRWSQDSHGATASDWVQRLGALESAIVQVRLAHPDRPVGSKAGPSAFCGALAGADRIVRPKGQTARENDLTVVLAPKSKRLD